MVPKNSFFTVDKTGDGKSDAIGLYIVNVISPFSIPPEIPPTPEELAKLAGVEDLNSIISLTIDGVDVGFDFKNLELRYEDKGITLETLGEAAGVTLPVGGKLTIIYDFPESQYPDGMTALGEHEVVIKYNVGGQEGELSAKREIPEERVAISYPPDINSF